MVPVSYAACARSGISPPLPSNAVWSVVARVQLEHSPEMRDRLLPLAERPEHRGQPLAGAHVRPRLQDAPEMALAFVEDLRSEGALSRRHALLVEPAGLARIPGALRQQ